MSPATTITTDFEAILPKASFGTRWTTALCMSICTSLLFFWLMYAVIHVSGHGINKVENLPTIDFVRLKRDSAPEQMERRKPPPPPPANQPAPPSKMKIDVDTAAPSTGIGIPTNLGLASNMSAGTGTGGGLAASMDSDLVPLQRIPPTFPADARRAGVSGFVTIDVTVNPDGSVRKARVIEAKPKGLFEAAAVTAIQKWRFKPKTVDGKAVEFHGVQTVKFDLNAAE
ncbi:energy transducer TonB [uncultured Nevskia sp.]|uniref:energy transducer TonB n=1 Tax=uncultured Nevskia sp. TaxID=228950 RepID=UPI0025CBE697|nr:energy transducer TonB [uncultured Nevskia sp.]